MGYILLVIAIVLAFKAATSKAISKNENIESKSIRENLNIKGELIYETYVKYCGGHPNLNEAGTFKINIYDNDIVIYKNNHSMGVTSGNNSGDGIVIRSKDIVNINVVDKTQIINDIKLSNVLLFGVAGLAINNKKKEEMSYVNLEYKINDRIFNLILSSDIEKDLNTLYKELTAGVGGLERMIKLSNSIIKISTSNDGSENAINIFQSNN